MTEAELLERVERIRRTAFSLSDVLRELDDLALDLATLPYLEANDRRPRHPDQGTPRTPDKEHVSQ